MSDIRHSDADRHMSVDGFSADTFRLVLLSALRTLALASVWSADNERRKLYLFAQDLKVVDCTLRRIMLEHDRELFPAHTERLARSRYPRQLVRHHPQHLVANIMSVRVIELFEVIDIYNCNGVIIR